MEQRFHIKWKNFSHLHNTDEVYEFLKRFKGLKRVDNYIKAYKADQEILAARNISPEERETILLRRERDKEELELHKTVERVIAQRENDAGQVEYFCKWNGLHYDHCTWELQDEIRPIAKEQIDAFRQREVEAAAAAARLAALRDDIITGARDLVPDAIVTGAWSPGDVTRRSPASPSFTTSAPRSARIFPPSAPDTPPARSSTSNPSSAP